MNYFTSFQPKTFLVNFEKSSESVSTCAWVPYNIFSYYSDMNLKLNNSKCDVTRVLKVIFRKQINTRFSVPVIVGAPPFTIWKAITRNSWKQSIKVKDSGVRWGKIRKRISIVKVLNQQSPWSWWANLQCSQSFWWSR